MTKIPAPPVSGTAGGSAKRSAGEVVAGAASSRTKTTAASLKSFNQYPFGENERVLCFHGPLLYEANVLNATDVTLDDLDAKAIKAGKEIGHHYFVHYKGWAKRWDEWVPESRVLKYNEENIARQQQLREDALPLTNKKSKNADAPTSSHTSAAQQSRNNVQQHHGQGQEGSTAERNKKRIRDTVDREAEYLRKQEVRLPIPDNLKVQLVDDWQFVTKRQQLVTLPRTPTAHQILEEWLTQRIAQNPQNRRLEDEATETFRGLKVYFNAALGNALLYRLEREQYRDILLQHKNTDICDLYGAEHLLRLFVSLPALVAHTTMDQRAMNVLKDHIADLLKFMVKNAKRFFQAEYEHAAPEYIANQAD